MKTPEYQKKAQKKYDTEKTESIRIRVPKGMKQRIKDHADKNGESVNAMFNRLIDNELIAHSKK